MARCSKIIIGSINVFGLIISTLCIVRFTNLLIHRLPGCGGVSLEWQLAEGIFLFVLSLVGLICVIWKIWILRVIYVSVMVITVIVLFFLFISLIIPKKTSGGGNDQLEKYTPWFVRRLVNENEWTNFKTCMIELEVCLWKPHSDHGTHKRLNWIESSCCRPPTSCGFDSENGTISSIPNFSNTNEESDCFMWSHNRDKLCFDCNSCKAAYVKKVVNAWYYTTNNIFCITIIIFLAFDAFGKDDPNVNDREIKASV